MDKAQISEQIANRLAVAVAMKMMDDDINLNIEEARTSGVTDDGATVTLVGVIQDDESEDRSFTATCRILISKVW